ncbi:myosin-9-like isoform X2 [Dysidea avara]|uniref:myosin-9-like isoform X2 n=1 Tax=Dysidea avara TaxID=196820 RepID=UPI00333364C1
MPSIFFWKRKRKRNKKKESKGTNSTEDNEAPQPPTPVSNSELAERAAAPVPPPVVEATYDVLQQPPSDSDHSVNTEPGYSVVGSHNKTITSSHATQQQPHSTPSRDNTSKHDDQPQDDDGSTKQPSPTLLDPEQLYTKVVRNKQQQQEQQLQSTATQPDEVEYSCLQHKKTNNDDVTNLLPSCSPQLYSILDSPHRPVIASYDSVKSIDHEHQQQLSSEGSSSASSGSDEDGLHHKHKSFQPISYLPPKSLSERRHQRTRKHVRHHHSDSSVRKRRHSTPNKDDHLRKDEFLVRGTTLDGSVTLYAATPIGSPLPVDQAQPIFNMMSSQPVLTNDTNATLQHQSLQDNAISQNMSWQQLPSMVHQRQPPISTVLHSQSMPCASSVNRFDPVTGAVLDQSVSRPPQSVNVPVTVSQHQPISSSFDQHQGVTTTELYNQGVRTADQHYQGGLIHQSRTTDLGIHHQGVKTTVEHHRDSMVTDQHNQGVRITDQGGRTVDQGQHPTSLYQDMLGLMQKREAGLKLELSSISADKDKLQSDNSRLLKENNTLRNDTSREAVPVLQGQVSSLKVENQMLQLTIEKLNEEISSNQLHQQEQQSLVSDSVMDSSNEISDLTTTEGDQPTDDEQLVMSNNRRVTSISHYPKSVPVDDRLSVSQSDSCWSKRGTSHQKSSLEENTILMKELERQQQVIKEMQQDHKFELSKMNRKLQRAYHDRDSLITTLGDMEKRQKRLEEKLAIANETISHQISLHDHQQSIKELQGMLNELMATHEEVTSAQSDKLKSLKREKKSLLKKLTEAKDIIVQLESQCTSLHQANRKVKEQMEQLQENMELSRDREMFIHNELSKTIVQAEKTAVERDTLAQLAQSQQKVTERAAVKRRKDKSTIKQLKGRVQQPQPDTGEVMTDEVDYAYTTDQELARQQEHCQKAIDHIKSLERSKQQELSTTATNSGLRNTHRQMDKLWKAAVTPKRSEAI